MYAKKYKCTYWHPCDKPFGCEECIYAKQPAKEVVKKVDTYQPERIIPAWVATQEDLKNGYVVI